MYPPVRRTDTPRRTVQIDFNGEIYDMDWDKPDPPTQTDFQNWVKQRRSITPTNPPPAPPPKLSQTPAARPDTGFLGGLGESIKGFKEFGGNLLDASVLNPDLVKRQQATKNILGGLVSPLVEGYKDIREQVGQGNYWDAIKRASNVPAELAGVPATGIIKDVDEGRYGHAAGQGVIPAALVALGTRGKLGAPEVGPEIPRPKIPPPVPEPVGLPFPEPPTGRLPFGPQMGPEVGTVPPQRGWQPTSAGMGQGPRQAAFEAMVPERYKTPPPPPPEPLPNVQPPLTEPGQGQLGFAQPLAEPIAEPGVAQPKTPWGQMRGERGQPAPQPPGAKPWTSPALDTPVGRAAASGIPELQDAAKKTGMFERIRQKTQGVPGARVAAGIGKGDISVIRDSGPTGPVLAQLLSRTRLLGDYLGGQWSDRARDATAGLSKEQQAVYVQARDTGVIPNDPAVIDALQKRAVLDAEVVQRTKASGAGLRTAEGKTIPFQERANHWPHIYDKAALKDKPGLVQKLIAEGWSPEDAQHAVDNAGRFGERLVSAQHERQGNAPGYRTDLDADYLHLHDMGKRVAEAESYGPLDTADPNSPISQLIKGTAEPQRVTEAVNTQLGRDVGTSGTAEFGKANQIARQVTTAAHLSHFALSNMSQLATIPLRANLSAYASALKKVMTDWKGATKEAGATGALETLDIVKEMGGEGFLSKAIETGFQTKRSETLNRTVSALSGKKTAQALFEQLKKDPTNKRARARLENLVLEPVDKVLKQDSLTPEQVGISGGRMAEITQGRAQSIDIPELWKGHPGIELSLIFKKYAFQQGRIIKDAVMENPARNIPLAIALYTAMGEGVGDVKAGVKGAVSGQDPAQAIADRGEGLNRIIADMSQAWAFGIFADVLESSTNKATGLVEYLAGPVLSDIGKAAFNAKQGLEGNWRGAARQGLSSVPYIGQGLAAQIKPAPRKKKGGGLPSLPSPKGLPSLPRP